MMVLVALLPLEANGVDRFRVVDGEFFWHTPNLTALPAEEAEKAARRKPDITRDDRPLGLLAYYEHFDTFTTPPPMEFWLPLEKGTKGAAEIRGGEVVFSKHGKRIPLNSSKIPSHAQAGTPYLLSIPVLDCVMVVYPYYFFRRKSNQHFVDAYSSSGEEISTLDFLPTHYLEGNPYLVASHERDCCSTPTAWTIRLQNLKKGSLHQYTCPEGACGDVIFHALGENGPIVLAHGIVSRMDGIGFAEQTNIIMIGREGEVAAAGRFIFASTPSAKSGRSSPFSVANLLAVDSLGKEDLWLVRFGRKSERSAFKLQSHVEGSAPAVVFVLESTSGVSAGRECLEVDGTQWGSLPVIAVAEPGIQEFSLVIDHKVRKKAAWKIQADHINVFHFEND